MHMLNHWLSCTPTMTWEKLIQRYARFALLGYYHLARYLGVINCQLNRRTLVVQPAKRCYKTISIVCRLIVLVIYCAVMPGMFKSMFFARPDVSLFLIAAARQFSVTWFAIGSFIMQARYETSFIAIVNRFVEIYELISRKTGVVYIFRGKFLFLLLIKALTTVMGCLNEVPATILIDHYFDFVGSVTKLIAIFMWVRILFVLDVCFLGFLVIAILYDTMGKYLTDMLACMKHIELDHGDGLRPAMSRYHRMKLLCEHADSIDECGVIYSKLYVLTKQFHQLFQWQILYDIYYNFMVILQLLHGFIWLYITKDYVDLISLLMVAINIVNLALLVMCADHVVHKSQLPTLLALDIVCSDIDCRWDASVETFLNHRKTENLEIKIMGFFVLNNEFILVVLSAIISYLFIMIQFGLTGGFEFGDVVKELIQRS